ncbi:MAG: DMT family transporter [Anaerolineales bacterium]|nr:DMT family transporter [Anaerolineales bacterium]
MPILFVSLIISLAAGIAAGLQGPLTTVVSQRLGTWEAVLIAHIGGITAAVIMLIFFGKGTLGEWRSVPWYALLCGVLGLVVLGGITFSIPRIGAASGMTLLILGQLLIAVLLDHFGLLGMDVRALNPGRVAGLLTLVLGTWLILR